MLLTNSTFSYWRGGRIAITTAATITIRMISSMNIIWVQAHSLLSLQQQQSLPSCIGGQGTLPYEQNTQQSPGFGLSSALQFVH